MTTLIFPAGMPRAIAYMGDCVKQRKAIVGASSLVNDPCRDQYEEWEFLPYVNDKEFGYALSALLQRCAVTEVFTANPVVWDVLKGLLPKLAPTVSLLGESPAAEMLAGYRSSKQVADRLWENRDFLGLPASSKARMGRPAFNALVRHADVIPGMCDHQKMLVLSEIFRDTPAGDIVEIGSWWGKSAFILAYLARQYDVGNLLCVDPWSDAHLVQDDKLVDQLSAEVSAEEAHQVFLANLMPYSDGNINFLRLPSVEGAAEYRKHRTVQTDGFGTTAYKGSIAVLHIDGNHEHSAVAADTHAWADLVIDGGWIVFDDYKWPYGDGPKLAADGYLASGARSISSAFFSGGALFVRVGA